MRNYYILNEQENILFMELKNAFDTALFLEPKNNQHESSYKLDEKNAIWEGYCRHAVVLMCKMYEIMNKADPKGINWFYPFEYFNNTLKGSK